jgi:hypothetical protein
VREEAMHTIKNKQERDAAEAMLRLAEHLEMGVSWALSDVISCQAARHTLGHKREAAALHEQAERLRDKCERLKAEANERRAEIEKYDAGAAPQPAGATR